MEIYPFLHYEGGGAENLSSLQIKNQLSEPDIHSPSTDNPELNNVISGL